MPIYKYQALTDSGIRKTGSLLADDHKQAYNSLCAKQYHPIKISKTYFSPMKVSIEDLLMFFLHIDFQLRCKVGINNAIESFIDFHGNKFLNASLSNILNALKDGESISDAFEKCRNIFDDVTIGLLKSAEKTGKTSEAISNILSFLRLQDDWKNNVKRTISYPIFIAVVAIAVLILSIGILGPQVIALIKNFGNGEVPILTQITIDLLPRISEIACGFFPIIFSIIFAFLFNKSGRKFLSGVALKIPKIGPLITKISIWQICKITHIALGAKLDFIEALELAIETVKFKNIKIKLKNVRDYIVDGYGISDAFSREEIISSGIIMAIHIGEEGNDLASSFDHISKTLYKEILFDIKSLGQSLSVGLTLFTGSILIFIVCALFYPIYSYVEISGA